MVVNKYLQVEIFRLSWEIFHTSVRYKVEEKPLSLQAYKGIINF